MRMDWPGTIPGMSDDKLLSTQELARHFRVRPETVLVWVSRGHIPSIKAGKARRYLLEDVVRALQLRDRQTSPRTVEASQ